MYVCIDRVRLNHQTLKSILLRTRKCKHFWQWVILIFQLRSDYIGIVWRERDSSHNLLVWLLGFGGNRILLFFVQYCRHHNETRQIQYHSLSCRMLHKKRRFWEKFCIQLDSGELMVLRAPLNSSVSQVRYSLSNHYRLTCLATSR